MAEEICPYGGSTTVAIKTGPYFPSRVSPDRKLRDAACKGLRELQDNAVVYGLD